MKDVQVQGYRWTGQRDKGRDEGRCADTLQNVNAMRIQDENRRGKGKQKIGWAREDALSSRLVIFS